MGLLLTMKIFPITGRDSEFTNYIKDLHNIPRIYAVLAGYTACYLDKPQKYTYFVRLNYEPIFKHTHFYIPFIYKGREVKNIIVEY